MASDPSFGREPIVITEELRDRIKASLLAAGVTCVTFSILVFSGQEHLPVAWIGNVVAISTLKSTLGDTIISTKNVFIPMMPVAICIWGISFLLGLASTKVYSILLPFVVMAGCFVIILCPWPYLTMKNLMMVIFYLIVASPLSLRQSGCDNYTDIQEDLGPWFVPGLMGTCTIGLSVALLVHIVMMPTPKSTAAFYLAQRLVDQLVFETHELLLSISEYTSNIGKTTSSVARQSRTLIEFYVKSRKRVLAKLECCLPAMRAERCLTRLLPTPLKYDLDAVEAYVACAKKQSAHAELIRLATTQQFLGEDFTITNETVRDVKMKISANLGFAVEQLAQEYVRSEHALFFAGSSRNGTNRDAELDSLGSWMVNYRKAMKQAITDAETLLQNDDSDTSRSTTGPLIRQRVAFLGVFSFVRELHDMMGTTAGTNTSDKVPESTIISRLTSTLNMPWLWGNLGKRRLALKTMIGLGLSSLWVSIPYLRGHIAYPNSIWVGITVASVSLETTGATWVKCLDRLWGTLVAGGYAMLIGKILDNSNSIAKLSALTAFTFAATFLSNNDRPYASRYAATSVGSILYGSFENGVAVNEYVPNRVMLIFVGVVTFLFVEMLVLPRSSRNIVQAQSMQFFEDLEHFLFDASKVFGSISSIRGNTDESEVEFSEDDPLWMLREGHEKITLVKELTNSAETVSRTVSLAKNNLKPGFAEPSLGLTLDVEYKDLLIEQSNILLQIDLLITTVKSLTGYYAHLPDDHSVRSLHWPALLSANVVVMAQRLSECADKLRVVFPHGLCRPGACEVSQVIRGVAMFQNFEDLILAILSDVANRHDSYLNMINSSGVEVRYTPGFRLTLALAVSAILTIGKSLNNCGKHLEKIVQSFPADQVTLRSTEQMNTTVHRGDDDDDNNSNR